VIAVAWLWRGVSREVAQLIHGDEADGFLGTITDSFTIGAFTRAWLRGLLPGLPILTLPGKVAAPEDGTNS
jgi:hypothetical protein